MPLASTLKGGDLSAGKLDIKYSPLKLLAEVNGPT
jgi:hypothetical protein